MKVEFNYYSGNIYRPIPLGLVTLDRFIEGIKNPKPNIIKTLNKVKTIKDKKEKRKLKHNLVAFTPSVVIEPNKKRNYNNIIKWTGLMQIDFDGMEKDYAQYVKKHIFENYDSIVCSFISPSGTGVKCLMKIETPKDKEHYKALHQGMLNTFADETTGYGFVDTATKNAVLPLFISYDKNILYRDFNKAKEWTYKDYVKPNYVHLNDANPTSFIHDDNSSYNYNRTIRIVNNRINNIQSSGHPQVVNASLILGSRVGAGYIGYDEALSILLNLINNNKYLQKSLYTYKKTAEKMFNEGVKNPKKY